jgi:tol-pal system protein YbgF
MTMNKVALSAAVTAAFLIVSGANVFAQAEVVESSNRLIPSSPSIQVSPQTIPAPAQSGASETFYQLQLLQQELSELRGLVEEQAYEIKRLKQQRLDDYISLDRRIVAASGSPAVVKTTDEVSQSVDSTDSGSEASIAVSQVTEYSMYQTAISLVRKQKDYVKGAAAFKEYLDLFPRGRYKANSQYWLGELSLLKGDLEQARQWFAMVVNESPAHDKVPDATYKLGTVYHKLGDLEKAKVLLNKVAQGNSNVSRLAKGYIANNLL